MAATMTDLGWKDRCFQSFGRDDHGGTGYIPGGRLLRVLNYLGIQDAERLIDSVPKSADGHVNYQVFLDLLDDSNSSDNISRVPHVVGDGASAVINCRSDGALAHLQLAVALSTNAQQMHGKNDAESRLFLQKAIHEINAAVALLQEASVQPEPLVTAAPKKDIVLQEFQESGTVPLSVKVAEVEIQLQSMSRGIAAIDAATVQLSGLDDVKDNASMSERGRKHVMAYFDDLTRTKEHDEASLKTKLDRFRINRNNTIAEFVPRLLQSVDAYQHEFDQYLGKASEFEALVSVPELCKPFNQTVIRQQLGNAFDPKSPHTLLALLVGAQDFIEPLCSVGQMACSAASAKPRDVLMAPSKQWVRAMQKAQDDYDGDYTRLIDLVRCTLVFDTVVELVAALRWLTEEAENGSRGNSVSLEVVRVKDRLSLAWDSELSGGNRDILLNGILTLCDGRRHVVEIQLHLATLLMLKEDLHTIYDGLRVLGASDPAVTTHVGKLTDNVLDRAKKGTLRKLDCRYTTMTKYQTFLVKDLLAQRVPCECPMLELVLDVATCPDQPAFAGWDLKSLLGDELVCRRLRLLQLGRVGLHGPIHDAIGRCAHLKSLYLHGNALIGDIPKEICRCTQLQKLYLYENHLTGVIPAEICRCTKLKFLELHANQLTGHIPESISHCMHLETLRLDQNRLDGSIPVGISSCTALKTLCLDNNDFEGTVPEPIFEMTNLRKLTLHANQLTGRIEL